MAVAPSSVADKIVVLGDDDTEENPQRQSRRVSLRISQQLASIHITQSPFATSKKQTNVQQAQKKKLFSKKRPASKMAATPALRADECIVQEDYEESLCPQPAFTASTLFSKCKAIHVLVHRAQPPASTLTTTRSPITTAEEQTHNLQGENEKLFSKFVEHCSGHTRDCPEVLTFLQTKYTKASPDYLSSVEFRNTLQQCLTCVQTNGSKTFSFINELCIVLRNRAAKKRHVLTRVESGSSTSSSLQSPFVMLKSKDRTDVKEDNEVEEVGKSAVEEEHPSTSRLRENKEDNKEQQEEAKKKAKSSEKQIAYLENLLKVYHEEICRLQQSELSLDDMEAEDSLYIQEHKLKRKMMKIYEKLCELKGCNTLTGRVIEQRIPYASTRYTVINRNIEHFINRPKVHQNPPDYQGIRQQVLQANKHHNLHLSRKQMNQIALDAFRETGNSMQERRHLDLVYNFGSFLTDSYKPASDPALMDPLLKRKLQLNREVAMSQLEEVFTKYAIKQDDIEEQERSHQLTKKGSKSKKGKEIEELNGVEEDEEETEEEEEEDYSSDPDIEEEIQASTQHNGPDDDENEKDNSNGAEQAEDDANEEDQIDHFSGSNTDTEEKEVINGHGNPIKTGECVNSSSHMSEDPPHCPPVAANRTSLPPPSAVTLEQSDTQTTHSTVPPPCPRHTRSQMREEVPSKNSPNAKCINKSRKSEPTHYSKWNFSSNGKLTEPEEPVDSSSPRFSAVDIKQSDTRRTNGTSLPLSPREIRSRRRKRKRKREEMASPDCSNSKHIIIDRDSSGWPEPMYTDDHNLSSNAKLAELVDSTNHISPVAANGTSLTPSSAEYQQNSKYADCCTVHCLICHKPQSNIAAHLSQVCMKRRTAEERAAECQKAKASSSMWVHANRTWYYDKICELLPHRLSRFAVIKDLLRRGFFIMHLPNDLVMNTEEASDAAVATISTASATSVASTSETVACTSDFLESSGTCGSPEVEPPSGPLAAKVSAEALCLASPPKCRSSNQRGCQKNRIKMKESGLYKKFPDHTNIIKDFKTYLIEGLHMPSYRLEMDNVSRYLRYLQPRGDILSLDFITKPAKTKDYLHKLKCMGLSPKSLMVHTRSIIRFYEFLRTCPDLKQKDPQLKTMLTTSKIVMKALRRPDTESALQEGYKTRCGQFTQEISSVTDCQDVLRIGKTDFTDIFDKLSSNMVVSEKKKTMYRYYLEAILLLRYFQHPTTVTNLTVQEWVNRSRAHGRVMIGTRHQRMATNLNVTVTITQEEEAWFQAYYKYIRSLHVGNRSCKTFFVTTTGAAVIRASTDLTRLLNMYNVIETRSRKFRRVVEAQAAEVLTGTQKEVVDDYLAQSSSAANKRYTGMAVGKLMSTFTEQSPHEQAAAESAAFVEKIPVSKNGLPPALKKLAKAGLTQVFTLMHNIKNQSWKGLAMKTFGDHKRLGVVATCRFPKGSIVCDYHGKIISAAEGRSLMEQQKVEANHLLFFKDICVDSQTVPCECHPHVDMFSRRINRSSDKPNLKPIHCVLKANEQSVEQDVILLEAVVDIEVDDELAF